ncbi:hypothetical protein C8R46DRAFT_1344219 [Mycena filopes]|nr:hypothetical protein C8R46DRAFT_1344219 [Mycena filopes]
MPPHRTRSTGSSDHTQSATTPTEAEALRQMHDAEEAIYRTQRQIRWRLELWSRLRGSFPALFAPKSKGLRRRTRKKRQ